jgi:protein-S-isoprenylcysteine O-methyltransferase Ste14
MFALDAYLPLLAFLWQPSISYLGSVLTVGGLVIASWHARLFKRIGANIQTFGEPTRLTRAGLFGYTRNPMYLGFVLVLLGLAIVLGSLSPFAGPLLYAALVNWWYIPFEERAMLNKFGPEYNAYCRDVRRWI